VIEPKPPATHRRATRFAWFLLLLSSAARAEPGGHYPELSSVFYDFEVAGYCGLVSNTVGQGFRSEARRLIERDGLDRETVSQLRGEAWQAAHAEWQNRGLGGFRNWCRTEGRAAVERFAGEGPVSSP